MQGTNQGIAQELDTTARTGALDTVDDLDAEIVQCLQQSVSFALWVT
jgi:hypothetical protein